MILEICVESFQSAMAAQRAGADRIELCENLYKGGLTPDTDLIKQCKNSLSIKLHVMIRPRAGNFFYSEEEFEIMKNEIEMVKQLNVDGVVFGIFTADGNVDVKRTKKLVELSKPMKTTFHRAFDVANNPFEALENIIECGCDILLTSGQKEKAMDGVELINRLNKKADGRIEIMAGSGVTDKNILEIALQTEIKLFHSSASINISGNKIYVVDEVMVREMKNKLNNYLC